jgi:hypothetical protein
LPWRRLQASIGRPEGRVSEADTSAPDARRRLDNPKTAVLVIHGMGEQRPMDTLRGLVNALWTCDRDVTGRWTSGTYSKPDPITGSFELRRITTRNVPLEHGELKRADFFEFYWAHLMTGNKLAWVVSWLRSLLLRGPASVPVRLVAPWLVGLAALLVVTALLLIAGVKSEWLAALNLPKLPVWLSALAGFVSVAFGWFGAAWLAPVVGDAARYLSPTPDNVGVRQKIREAGVDLLGQLHASGYYDRIIVVGHSLGSVIGYDVLYNAWARLEADALFAGHATGSAASRALAGLEKAAGGLIHPDPGGVGAARVAYRAAQRTYAQALAESQYKGRPLWLVSDFVTMGSPLANADVLIGKDPDDLRARIARREAPSNPPWLEKDDVKRGRFRLSYPIDAALRIPHHAAVFAPVVWTNIFFENALIVFGDIIGGPVAPVLGRGVLDVRLKIGAPVFRHLDYWKNPTSDPPEPWLRALRRAVNLRRLDEATLWGRQAASLEILADLLSERVPSPPSPRSPLARPAPPAPAARTRPARRTGRRRGPLGPG